MGFISFSLSYYERELRQLEQEAATAESIYKAKQLLKMLDDLLDEGYTELNETLEKTYQGVSRLKKYLQKNGAEPFGIGKKKVAEEQLQYSEETLELVQALDAVIEQANQVTAASKEPFLQDLRRFCEWIGYEEDTAYVFLLRDTLLPYVYYRAKERNAVYPWLLGRKTLEHLTGKLYVDDEIRASVIKALEEEKCGSFEDFCEVVLPDIRNTLKIYPGVQQCLNSMLGKITEKKIIVVESGCSGTFPMLLKSLDERVDVRMYTTYPYLFEAYGNRIFTTKYEENRLFETFASQNLYFQFSSLQNGQFLVKRCENAQVEEKTLEEIKTMMNNSICGADCAECMMKDTCEGCLETKGCPFGKQCFIAEYINVGGKEKYLEFKQQLISEFNELHIPGMPEVKELYALNGSFVNLEYTLPNGQTVKFLDDNSIYLGNQLECELGEGRCFGIVSSMEFLMVCTYGENGAEPELVLYKRR